MKNTRMGKLWSMVLCICLLASMVCMVSAAENPNPELVPNGTFTADGEGSMAGFKTSTDATVSVGTEGENHYLTFTNDASEYVYCQPTVTANTYYTYSFSYRTSESATAKAQYYVYVYSTAVSGKGSTAIAKTVLEATNGEWKTVSAIFLPVANAQGDPANYVRAYVEKSAGTGSVDFDNISIKIATEEEMQEAQSVKLTNILQDGGFESGVDIWTPGMSSASTTKPEWSSSGGVDNSGCISFADDSKSQYIKATAKNLGIVLSTGDRYLLGFDYKSNKDLRVDVYQRTTSGAYVSKTEITVPAASAWTRAEIIFEIAPNTTGEAFDSATRSYLSIGEMSNRTGAEVFIDNTFLAKLNNIDGKNYAKTCFYKSLAGAAESETEETADKVGYDAGRTYAEILGTPISSLEGYTGNVTAAFVGGQAPQSAETLIFASYNKVGNTKQLVNLSVGTPATLAPKAELAAEGAEMRAFVWKSLNSLAFNGIYPATLK